MKQQRPLIAPRLLASLIEQAPARIRKRLDSSPRAAESWVWQPGEPGWKIDAGGQTVTLRPHHGRLDAMEQVECTCLLSPKCFHLLACLTQLPTATPSDHTAVDGTDVGEEDAGESTSHTVRQVAVSRPMKNAAEESWKAVQNVLQVGGRACGTLIQAALLRASHDCRAAGLPSLANQLLRIVEGIRRLRAMSDNADSETLRRDVLAALETASELRRNDRVPVWVAGITRRIFEPADCSKLAGWFAEPVLTRSGYTGICVYFLDDDHNVYHLSEVKPSDASLVANVYRGGITLGSLTLSGRELCRQRLHLLKPTVSLDGRLGRGQATRWQTTGSSPFHDKSWHGRFADPIATQIDEVFAAAQIPVGARTAGWNLISFDAVVLGARGSALLVRVQGSEHPWHLDIALDEPELPFRENLEMLAHTPGLALRCVGRCRLDQAGHVDALAIGEPSRCFAPDDSDGGSQPRLCLPAEWEGRCNLGLDRLQRHHIASAHPRPDSPEVVANTACSDDGLYEINRHLQVVTLGGCRSLAAIGAQPSQRSRRTIAANGYPTGADLLELLSVAAHTNAQGSSSVVADSASPDLAETALACSVYVDAARREFHRQCWRQLAGHEP